MPNCKKCDSFFPNWKNIDGRLRNLGNRSFCLTCSPFKQHNTKDLCVPPIADQKFCHRCKTYKTVNQFYKRRAKIGFTPYCKSCHNDQALERQRRLKKECVDYLGGKCSKCGYNKCMAAIEFHHIDPTQKDFSISRNKSTSMNEVIKAELDKCIPLCRNCHAEEHYLAPVIGLEPI